MGSIDWNTSVFQLLEMKMGVATSFGLFGSREAAENAALALTGAAIAKWKWSKFNRRWEGRVSERVVMAIEPIPVHS